MKNIVLFTILLFTKQYPSEYILIEHIGWSDKPVFSILITNNKINMNNDTSFIDFVESNMVHKYRIGKKHYNNVQEIIRENCVDTVVEKCQEYGTFKVSIYNQDKRSFKCFLIREDASELFSNLIKVVEGYKRNDDLVDEFETLLRRLR